MLVAGNSGVLACMCMWKSGIGVVMSAVVVSKEKRKKRKKENGERGRRKDVEIVGLMISCAPNVSFGIA